VYLLPYEYQLRKGIKNPQQLFSEALKSHNIPVNDLAPAFAKQGNIKSLYLYGDGIHFSEKGHRVVAEFLYYEKY
jgi:lysophospholipase L1-like esterase